MANAITPVGGTGRYDPQIQKLLADIENYGKFDYSGEGSYKQILDNLLGYGDFAYTKQGEYDAALDKVINPEAFSYNVENDPTWSSYKKIYRREGDRAAADTLARASTATGGIPSSYAVSAAQQAQNYYNGQMADIIPTLQQNAYQKYLDDYSRTLTGLDALTADRNTARSEWMDGYSKLQSDLSALEADRSHQYGKWQDGYNMLNTSLGNYSAINESTLAQQQEAYNRLLTLITTTGYTPSAADLAAAGMSTEEAAAWGNYYAGQSRASSSRNSNLGGSEYEAPDGWDEVMIKRFQKAHGLPVNGTWDQKTQNAYNKDKDWEYTPDSAYARLRKNLEILVTSADENGNTATKKEISESVWEAVRNGEITQNQAQILLRDYTPRGVS